MSPSWEIPTQDFFSRLNSDAERFRDQLRLPDPQIVQHVVPLRSLTRVKSVIPLSRELLHYLLSKIGTLSGLKPFTNARFELRCIDPRELKIGQRFVYRENYIGLLETLPDLIPSEFARIPGLNNLEPCFIFGLDQDGVSSLSCYLPPLIERHGNALITMDGIHRGYLTKQFYPSMVAIVVSGVGAAFPCAPHPWPDIQVIPLADKPPRIEDRYFELKKDLFRNLKYLGIDG